MQPINYTSTDFEYYHTGVRGVYFRPSVSSNPQSMFMFCIADPAAPFIKLSDAESDTSRWLSSSISNPMSQKFDPIRNLGSGNLYSPFLSRINLRKGSPL